VTRPSLETYLERKWIALDGRPGPGLCVVTRVRVQKLSHTLVLLRSYRRMRRLARTVPGLLQTTFALAGGRTLYFVSLWSDHEAMARFASAVHDHAQTVGWARRHGAEAWSGLFELRGASRSSDGW
jgi:hypothetical protein